MRTIPTKAKAMLAWLPRAGTLALAVLVGLGVCAAGIVLGRVADLGPELSDSGMYLLMQQRGPALLAQITLAGPLLASILGDLGVQATRVVHYVLLFVGPAGFMLWVSREADQGLVLEMRLALAGIAGAGAWVYFKWMLLDPNYNSLTIPLYFAALAGFWGIWERLTGPGPQKLWPVCIWTGAVVLMLALVKVSAALATVVSFALPGLACVIWMRRRKLGALGLGLGVVLGAGLLGAGLVLVWLWMRGQGGPIAIWGVVSLGLEFSDRLDVHSLTWPGILRSLGYWGYSIRAVLLALALPIALVLAGGLALQFTKDLRLRLAAGVVAALSLGAVTWALAQVWGDFAPVILRVWGVALSVWLLALCARGPRRAQVVVFGGMLAFGPLVLVFGSFATWSKHAAMFTGVCVVLPAFLAVYLPRQRGLMAGLALILCGFALTGALREAHLNPYRMGAPVARATEVFEVQGERFRVTPPLAGTYARLADLETRLAALPEPPLLIDMTGRAPTLAWALGMRVPSIAWALSGYGQGSDSVLGFALSLSDPGLFLDAWILIDQPRADGTRYGLSEAVLNAALAPVGRHFPRDFEKIDTLPVAYMKFDADLWVPKRP